MSTARIIRPGSSSCGSRRNHARRHPLFTCCCFSRSRCPALRMGRQRALSLRQSAQPEPPAADTSRSLFEPAERQFQIGGRFTSVDGDPARFQRYQDLRDGLLFTDVRYAWAEPSGSWQARVAADNVGWRDQRYSGKLRAHRAFRGLWSVGSDPAVLQRRYPNAVHQFQQSVAARRCDAARDPERPGDTVCVSAARIAVRPSRAAEHRDVQRRLRHQRRSWT